jgi:hypothetical protein
VGLLMLTFQACAWNAAGHRLIAQIAYDQLTPQAKETFERYNKALEQVYRPSNFINSAIWLDTLVYQDIHWFVAVHYIDLPFSTDGTPIPLPQRINAVWTMKKAKKLLFNKYPTDFDKGIAFRVLLHVGGDLHQPLHAATRISQQFPQGDKGGNLMLIKDNSVAKNLHTYWDRGGGLLLNKRGRNKGQIKKWARSIETKWPCTSTESLNPAVWAKESHQLAVNIAYKTEDTPDKVYQEKTKKITEQQIALAGCRLGALFNQIAKAKV